MADFQLPIEKFLVQKIQEHFPDFDLREGTAFRDMLIKPMLIFMQPYRDQVNVLKRNQALQNFETMIDEEMNALASNIFVTRRGGVNSEGVVRVYITAAAQVSFSTTVQFQTTTGLVFNPKTAISFTAEELALNVDGLYFFADVPCVAANEGEEYNIAAHAIVFISGGPSGVAKVDNLAAFAKGINIEDNATLQDRAKTSIAIRDLVIKKSISAVMLENFNTLREVAVIGFGDPEMERDVISTILELLITVDERDTGDVTTGITFEDNDIIDPIDFVALGIQPGHRLVILSGADAGNHTIKAVLGPKELQLYDTLTVRTGVNYGLDGMVITDRFHIGGKVDVYVDTTKLEEDTFYLDPASELNPLVVPTVTLPVIGIKNLSEVDPATHEQILPVEDHTLWPEHTRIIGDFLTGAVTGTGNTFDDNTVDFITTGVKPGFSVYIIDGLDAGSHVIDNVANAHRLILHDSLTVRNDVNYRVEANDYRLETTNPDTRLSINDEVRIRLLQNDPLNPNRYFIGSTLGATYYTDTTIAEYQAYVQNDLNRVVTTDILIRRCLPIFIDLHIDYRGTAVEADVINIIREFIDSLKIGSPLQASDIIATLYFFNIDYVANDFLIQAYKYNLDGSVTPDSSTIEIVSNRTSKYIPRNITVTKMV